MYLNPSPEDEVALFQVLDDIQRNATALGLNIASHQRLRTLLTIY
jgi:hypothetical protein